MIIRQEEETPIGNHFHDTGVKVVFTKIEDIVDEFEVDTESLLMLIDSEIDKLKSLKNVIKREEAAWAKKIHNQELNDSIHRG